MCSVIDKTHTTSCMTTMDQPEGGMNTSLYRWENRGSQTKGKSFWIQGLWIKIPLLFITLWLSFLRIRNLTYIRYRRALKHPFFTFTANTIVPSGSPTRTHYIVAVRSLPLTSHAADPALPFISCLICIMKTLILI